MQTTHARPATKIARTIDLGCMNSWVGPTRYPDGFNGPAVKGEDRTPASYLACVAAGHERHEIKLGNCYHRYDCPTCGIRYTVDSGD